MSNLENKLMFEEEQDLEVSEETIEQGIEVLNGKKESNEQENTEDDSETLENLLIDQLIPIKTKVVNKKICEPGVITVINSKKNGRRITIASSVMEKLNNPEKLNIAFWDDGLLIGEELPNTDQSFPVKLAGKKGIIYSVGLVQEITSQFDLDFSNRVSLTFQTVTYKRNNSQVVALFEIRN